VRKILERIVKPGALSTVGLVEVSVSVEAGGDSVLVAVAVGNGVVVLLIASLEFVLGEAVVVLCNA
jgi:hypothetical protein